MKIRHGGELREAELLEITQEKPAWSEFILADGTLIRARVAITEVHRIVDAYADDGSPAHYFQWSVQVVARVPDEFKRPAPPAGGDRL